MAPGAAAAAGAEALGSDGIEVGDGVLGAAGVAGIAGELTPATRGVGNGGTAGVGACGVGGAYELDMALGCIHAGNA